MKRERRKRIVKKPFHFSLLTFYHEISDLSVLCNGIDIIHSNKGKAFLTITGMGEEEKLLPGRIIFLWILSRQLGGVWTGCNLSAETLSVSFALVDHGAEVNMWMKRNDPVFKRFDAGP